MGKKGKTKYDGLFIKDQLYGKWVILNETIIIDKEAKVFCKCTECNITERYVPAFQLLNGVSKRCSLCGYSNKGNENPAWKGYGLVPASKITRIRCGAVKRKIPFDLDIIFLSKLFNSQNGLCKYSKLPISFKDNTASLERIDSKLGYYENNVIWVHKNLNIMKREIPFNDFYNICKLVVENCEIK